MRLCLWVGLCLNLCPSSLDNDFSLLGGLIGTYSLVSARGLCQPRAGGGLVFPSLELSVRDFASFPDILKDEDNEVVPQPPKHKTNGVSDRIGRPMAMDELTATRSRLGFARMCVEVTPI